MINIKKVYNRYKLLPVQVRASFWFLICSFLQKGISVLATPIFTRLFTTEEYGQYSIFNTWLGIITIFVTLNLSSGVYAQGLIKFEDQRKQFSSSMQGLSTCLIAGWTGVYFIGCDFWNRLFSLTTVQMLAMLVMIWTSSVFNFWASAQRVLYRYRMLAILTICVSIAKPVIGIVFVINAEDKVTARILGLVLVELVGYMALFFIQMYQGKRFFYGTFWKNALLFNLPLIPHYLSQTILSSADRVMISSMVGDSEAGIYSLAYSLSYIMTLINIAFMQTLSPWIYRKIKKQKIKDIASVAYTSMIIVALTNLALILLAPEAVTIFAPKTYYDAIWVVPPVAMSVFFMYCYDLFAKFAFYYEKTKIIMMASILGAIFNLVLNYFFIPKFGYIVAGYTTLVCYIVYFIAHYMLMRKVCYQYCYGQYPYETKKILMITLLFMVAGFAISCSYNYPVIRFGIIMAAIIITMFMRRRIKRIVKDVLKIKNYNNE